MSRIAAIARPVAAHPLRQAIRFNALKRKARSRRGFDTQDLRDFLLAYCACFLAVSTFIA
jgi:hypothetical protein